MNKIITIVLTLLLSLQLLQAQDTWIKKENFPYLRYRAVAFSIDEFGYVGTGISPSKRENDFWKYDPVTDVWEQIDSMPAPGREGAISFVINAKGFVGGGFTDMGFPNNDFWEYDPQINHWTQKADIPIGVSSVSNLTAFSIGNMGYIRASGNDEDFWEYNLANDIWIQKSNFPGDGKLGQIGFSINTKGYLGTGFGENGNTAEFWEYNQNTDKWTQMEDFPGSPRNGAVGFSIGNNGYVGLGNTSGTFPNDFWEYDQESDSWTQISDCGFSAEGAFSMNIGSKGYVGTGVFIPVGEFWEYTPIMSSINNFELLHAINIFPNPVSEILFLNHDIFENEHFRIYKINGQIVLHDCVYNNSINVSGLPNGLYLLKIQKDKTTYSEKFIKE